MEQLFGFDNKKQKGLINELQSITTTTAGKTTVTIDADDLDGSITNWFVVGLVYQSTSSSLTTCTPTLPTMYVIKSIAREIEVGIDNKQGATVTILLQKAKEIL